MRDACGREYTLESVLQCEMIHTQPFFVHRSVATMGLCGSHVASDSNTTQMRVRVTQCVCNKSMRLSLFRWDAFPREC